MMIAIPDPQVEGTKSITEVAFLTGGMGQRRSQSKAQHSAMTPQTAGTPDQLPAGTAAAVDLIPEKAKN